MAISFTYECRKPTKIPKSFLIDICYLAQIVQACEAVLEQAVNHPNIDLFEEWFGSFDKKQAQFDKAKLHTEAILKHARSHPIILNQVGQITFAVTDKAKGDLEIGLGSYSATPAYSFGEWVVTILHELSHKTPGLMTDDVAYGTVLTIEGTVPDPAYRAKAVKLARERPTDAFRNAENWGYYLASYYHDAGLKGDWSNTDTKGALNKVVTEKMKLPAKGKHWQGSTWTLHKQEKCGCVPDGENLPIVKYKVCGDAVEYDRAKQPLITGASPTKAPIGVTHVKKARSSDGKYKCTKCGAGFDNMFIKQQHQVNCK